MSNRGRGTGNYVIRAGEMSDRAIIMPGMQGREAVARAGMVIC